MTNALLMLVAAIGGYSAGLCTMSFLQYRRQKLAEPIPLNRLPPRPPMAPLPRPIEPQRASEYAPRYLSRGEQLILGKALQKSARRQIHWPIARAEPEKPPPMVRVERRRP